MIADMLHLDVESMRTLLAVLDRGGMTKAAEHLGVSQSAVSWKIKRLEQRVGRPLLIRDGHSLHPSREARILLDDARTMIEAHDRAVHRLNSPDFTGTVKVGCNEQVSATRMAAVLGRFRRIHPAATVEFVVNQSRRLAKMVDDGVLDVAIMQVTADTIRADDVVLWTDDLRWATSIHAPYDEGVVPLITFGENGFYRPVVEPILRRHGIEYAITFSAPTSNAVRAAVEAGLGVAVLGSWFISGDIVEWVRGQSLDPLPQVHQIARTVPGEHPITATAVVESIVAELTDLPSRWSSS